MNSDLAQEAIQAALSGNWKDALQINQKILKSESNDIDSLNRLARAYAELGNLKKARVTAQRVLKFDPFNSIASKAIEKWKGLKKGETYTIKPSDPQIFLEEPGKTKIISLIHLGSPRILAKLDAGDGVVLNTHSHRICVTTTDGKYIGRLPDDLSARLKKLTSLGNQYLAFVKCVDLNDVKIFIKEEERAPKLKDVASFSSEKIDYISFTPPELVHRKDEMEVTGEEEE